jgi:hypothetical protein
MGQVVVPCLQVLEACVSPRTLTGLSSAALRRRLRGFSPASALPGAAEASLDTCMHPCPPCSQVGGATCRGHLLPQAPHEQFHGAFRMAIGRASMLPEQSHRWIWFRILVRFSLSRRLLRC